MKNVILVVCIMLSASCSPALRVVEDGTYYDKITLGQIRMDAANREIKKAERKMRRKTTMVATTVTIFGVYCILAWKYDIE